MNIITPSSAAFVPGGPLTPSSVATILDEVRTIDADIAASPTTFWTATSPNSLAGSYQIVLYFEIISTTLNVGCILNTDFTLNWDANATPQAFDVGAGALDATLAYTDSIIELIDNASAVSWQYAVTGYVSGTAQVRFKATLIRLA